ncbi:colicin E3/pyocin S6 family cytotoxin [Corynebacterium aquatimens]|uniref:Colicin E3-like ribonuclease domain-containing protein n=1 Tax=Corynebacterium aquatimens TaxID=1190508 RepID=A0A931E2P9_9CORY|nr:colicin E3/pyocin S6 family cytotoxin [Corynebacterium aquatimens]MBG6121413.1 hypothetical protein [Corynebacterium aquatimens]WJY66043.1 Cytotoxic [Corynebacterium aquatimens]
MAAAYIPRPNPSFLDGLERVKRSGTQRWRDPDQSIVFEYDRLHGHVEGYNRRGEHIGIFDVHTGHRIGQPVRGKKIDV